MPTRYSGVRTRLGTWTGVNFGSFVQYVLPNNTVEVTAHLTFSCSVARRYRFRLQQADTNKQYTYYYPSSTTFTTRTSIDIGDLNRSF